MAVSHPHPGRYNPHHSRLEILRILSFLIAQHSEELSIRDCLSRQHRPQTLHCSVLDKGVRKYTVEEENDEENPTNKQFHQDGMASTSCKVYRQSPLRSRMVKMSPVLQQCSVVEVSTQQNKLHFSEHSPRGLNITTLTGYMKGCCSIGIFYLCIGSLSHQQ